VRNRAAKAAIGQLDDIFLEAACNPAGLQDRAIDAKIAELVDDEREPPPIGIFERVPDQRRLACAKKAGDDRDGHFGLHHETVLPSSGLAADASGGTRAATPLRTLSGRSRQTGTPSGSLLCCSAKVTMSAR